MRVSVRGYSPVGGVVPIKHLLVSLQMLINHCSRPVHTPVQRSSSSMPNIVSHTVGSTHHFAVHADKFEFA